MQCRIRTDFRRLSIFVSYDRIKRNRFEEAPPQRLQAVSGGSHTDLSVVAKPLLEQQLEYTSWWQRRQVGHFFRYKYQPAMAAAAAAAIQMVGS